MVSKWKGSGSDNKFPFWGVKYESQAFLDWLLNLVRNREWNSDIQTKIVYHKSVTFSLDTGNENSNAYGNFHLSIVSI